MSDLPNWPLGRLKRGGAWRSDGPDATNARRFWRAKSGAARAMTAKPFGVNLTFLPSFQAGAPYMDYSGGPPSLKALNDRVKPPCKPQRKPFFAGPERPGPGPRSSHKCTSVPGTLKKAQAIGCDARQRGRF